MLTRFWSDAQLPAHQIAVSSRAHVDKYPPTHLLIAICAEEVIRQPELPRGKSNAARWFGEVSRSAL